MTQTESHRPKQPNTDQAPAELPRVVSLAQIGALGTVREVVATADECAAVAARLLIPAVGAISCRFQLTPGQDGVVVAEGALVATVTQVCVVTLEPFDAELREVFRVRFVPDDQLRADQLRADQLRADQFDESEDDMLDLEADDEVPYHGIQIDLGEAAVEQLALALDPYPRMPGAELPAASDDDDATPASPFAALARRTRQA